MADSVTAVRGKRQLEPGPAAAAINQLRSDLGALRAASRQLVFHYWADGDYAANGITKAGLGNE